MASELDVFTQINNAVLDLQAAQFQTYERPLKALGRLLRHEDLAEANRKLTDGLDVDTFLATSGRGSGGMVGGDRLEWPEDHEKALGLTLLLIDRFASDPRAFLNFAHTYFYTGRKVIGDVRALVSQMIIPFVRDYKAFIMNNGTLKSRVFAANSTRIFVVHGHDEGARESVARFLERLGFDAIILHEQANRGRTIIEKVEANSDVGFAVVLLTPDDQGSARDAAPAPRVRQNVLLELGYFIGKLGRERVCALKKGEIDIPSDFAGVVWEAMDANGGWKQALGRELEAAGYSIDWNRIMR